MKSGKITDYDRLFNHLANQIHNKYTDIGIELGLESKVLSHELETGIFKMLQAHQKAVRMLQLWHVYVSEDDFTYSVLAAALEKHGFHQCAQKYCYTTGNHMKFIVRVLMGIYVIDYNFIEVHKVEEGEGIMTYL